MYSKKYTQQNNLNPFLFVQTLCTLLDCLLTPENIPSDSPRELYETYFTFACIWAFGGALYQDQVLFCLFQVDEIEYGKKITINIFFTYLAGSY